MLGPRLISEEGSSRVSFQFKFTHGATALVFDLSDPFLFFSTAICPMWQVMSYNCRGNM